MAGTANSTESTPATPTSTFVVRFWREWADGAPRWRGRIEHLQSGESAAFLELAGMLEFVRRFGMMVEGKEPGAGREEVEA